MNKLFPSAAAALHDVQDGLTLMAGGFGLCGNPENLITALHARGTKGIRLISNNCGTTELGLGVLLQAKQIESITASYVGENKEFERQYLAGELKVELVPQGTLAERIRAGGAGLGGFFTPTGYGTQIAEGKECREIDGRWYVFEKPLRADVAIVRAWKADRWGNLVFRKTARNFSPMMCKAAKLTIVEAEQIVEVGQLAPDEIHVPSVYVHRLVQGQGYQRWIERRTTRPKAGA